MSGTVLHATSHNRQKSARTEEHLPEETPKSEYAEEDGDNKHNGEGEADAAVVTPPGPKGRMPNGQLPTQTKSEQPPYMNQKQLAKENIEALLDADVTCKSVNRLNDCCSRVFTDWKRLFSKDDQKSNCETENWTLLVQHPRFE